MRWSEQHTLQFIKTLRDIYDLQKSIKDTDVTLYDGKEMVTWDYERLVSYKTTLKRLTDIQSVLL